MYNLSYKLFCKNEVKSGEEVTHGKSSQGSPPITAQEWSGYSVTSDLYGC